MYEILNCLINAMKTSRSLDRQLNRELRKAIPHGRIELQGQEVAISFFSLKSADQFFSKWGCQGTGNFPQLFDRWGLKKATFYFQGRFIDEWTPEYI